MVELLAIPEVDAVLVALIAAVFLLGFEPTRRLLRGMLSALPVIGGTLARTADDLLTRAWADIANWLNSLVDGIDSFITSLWRPLFDLVTQIELVFESVFFKLSYILATALPEAIAWLAGAVQTLVAGVRTELLDAISTLASQVYGSLTALGAEIVNVYNVLSAAITNAFNAAQHALTVAANDVVSWAYTTITDLTTSIYSTVGDVVSWATATFGAVESWVATEIQGVIAWTASEIATVEGLITTGLSDTQKWVTNLWTTAITAPLSVIWDNVQREANTVVQQVEQAFPDVADQLQSIPQSVPLDIIGAITSLYAIAQPLTTFVDRCGMPLCENLNQYGKDLKELQNIVGDGLLLAFIVAAVEDPKAIAHTFTDVTNPITRPVFDAMKAVL